MGHDNSDYPNIQYSPNESLVSEIQTYYSRILDSAALNVADPIGANIGYFNNSGKVYADPMKLGKTVVFMTRPNLNFRSIYNIRRSRIFSYFMRSKLGVTLMRELMFGPTANYMVYGQYPFANTGLDPSAWPSHVPVRGGTDDTLVGGVRISKSEYGGLSIPILDTNFVPMMTNLCTEVSNAKDIILDVKETEGDFNGNKLQYASGIDESMSIGEINLTFDDLYYSPIMNFFNLWIMYMHYVGKGICDPEYWYLVNRIIDYTCSIYVFMLGTDQQTILRWTRYTGCFPKSIPFGQIMHSKEVDQGALRNVQIPFAYNFASPMDPIILTEFNMISGPSLFARFRKLSQMYGNNYIKYYKYTRLLDTHTVTTENAMHILNEAGPVYDTSNYGFNSDLPLRKLEPGSSASHYPQPTGFENVENSAVAKLTLKNREYGNISNNWYGVPYIVGGNKLMWL